MRSEKIAGIRRIMAAIPSLLLSLATGAMALASQPYKATLVESSPAAMVYDILFDSVQVSQSLHAGQWLYDVELPGAACTDTWGLPRLPVTSLILGAPPSGSARLTILAEESTTRAVGLIRTADKPSFSPADPEESEAARLPLREIEGWYPARTAELGLDGMFRSQRVVQIYLRPVRHSHRENTLQVIRKLRVRLDFAVASQKNGASLSAQAAAAAEPAEFERLLAATLVNYEQSKGWRQASVPSATLARETTTTGARFRIEIEGDGVYAITGKELAAVGANLAAIDPATLAMTHLGRSVALHIEGGSDGKFAEEDRLIFIGRHNSAETFYYSQYSDRSVYWLTWGSDTGSRFAETVAAPAAAADTLNHGRFQIHLEKDLVYERTLDNNDPNLDHWYWAPASSDYEFALPLPVGNIVAGGPLDLEINMLGLTHIYQANPDHHVRFYLNQQQVGEAYWDNQTPHTASLRIAKPEVKPQDNLLRFNLPLDIKGVNIDKILVNYVDLDFTGKLAAARDSLRAQLPASTTRLVRIDGFSSDRLYAFSEEGQLFTGYRMERRGDGYSCIMSYQSEAPRNLYFITEKRLAAVASITEDQPSQLATPSNGADYIIITHADFRTQAERLAQHRAAEGLRTMVVDVQDVYDEFSYGTYDPNALRDFVAYAYNNWSKPAPLYLLLFGTTTHYMNKKAAETVHLSSYVPTLMVFTNSWGMTSSDNALVAVSGNDILPDLYVGRFPVKNSAEAEIMVQKSIDYEKNPVIDEWRRSIGMVYAEGDGGRFIRDAEELIAKYTPSRVNVQRLTTLGGSPYYGNTETLAEMINSGTTLVNFIGHGGGGVYFDNSLFEIEDVKRLSNKNRYPVVFSMTCFVGHFDNPEMASLGQELVLARDRGAVAHFGSAAKASADGDYYLNIALFNALFEANARKMGEIITLGKLLLIEKTNGYWDNVRHFVLLGDPGLAYHISDESVTIKPSRSAYFSGETISASGQSATITQGTAIVTLSSAGDSVLARKEVALQNGAWQCDLLTLGPENISRFEGGLATIRVFVHDARQDAAAAAIVSVAGNALVQIQTEPALPTHQEPVYFQVTVDESALAPRGGVREVALNVSANKIAWQRLPLVKGADGLWRTTQPLQQNEGTALFYQSIVTTGSGDKIVGEISSRKIGYRPDLTVDPNSILISGQSTRVWFRMKNTGDKDSGPFNILVTEGVNSSSYKPLGDKLKVLNIPANSDSLLSVLWAAPTPGERKLWFQTDGDHQVDESNEGNNVTLAIARVVTAAAGTSGPLYLPASNGYIEIPAGALTQSNTLIWTQEWDDTQAKAAEWSGLLPLSFRYADKPILYGYRFADTTQRVNKEIKVVGLFNTADAQMKALARSRSVRLYGWNPATRTWNGLASVIDSTQGTVTAMMPPTLRAFSLLASQDDEAPVITLSVGGQNFADGDVVSRRPLFSAYMEDATGFDMAASGLELTLDGQPVQPGQYSLFQSVDARRSLTLTFAPELAVGGHTLQLSVRDINGNSAAIQAGFAVEGVFGLTSLANHPNPFQRETTIAFLLTETAERVKIGIYTVSGRLIRQMEQQGVTGYVELDWDGTDEDGNEVANGVYYLKFVAEQGEKRIERIEKMARLQ